MNGKSRLHFYLLGPFGRSVRSLLGFPCLLLYLVSYFSGFVKHLWTPFKRSEKRQIADPLIEFYDTNLNWLWLTKTCVPFTFPIFCYTMNFSFMIHRGTSRISDWNCSALHPNLQLSAAMHATSRCAGAPKGGAPTNFFAPRSIRTRKLYEDLISRSG